MPQYRKKPVAIDAFRLIIGCQMPDWFVDALVCGLVEPITPNTDNPNLWGQDGVAIKTLEGQMTARVGDWVIRGVVGEIYPCRDDIFQATYESVAAPMREHIHVPAHDEHVHQPRWDEPSRDAEGRAVADIRGGEG